MTDSAIIQGSYSDYRRVKGRAVLQLIIEVPLEMAPKVHEAFGEPLPNGTTWVAVARLTPSVAVSLPAAADAEAGSDPPSPTTQVPASEPAKPKGGKLAMRAGILSNEGAFHAFLLHKFTSLVFVEPHDFDAKTAATIVRNICGIASRAELDHNPEATRKFLDLESRYVAWREVAE